MEERLQKIIARAGVASRRHAEELIVSGLVTVNGEIITQLGSKADASRDHIKVSGRLLRAAEDRVYLLLHKPPETVCTMSDPEGRKSLRDFLGDVRQRVFPVGRLEYHVSGLVLLTNDGEFANRVLQARKLRHSYHLKLKSLLTLEEIEALSRAAGARICRLRGKDKPWYEATLFDASRDVLRDRLFQTGHPVERMKRVCLGNISLGALGPGEHRLLSSSEVASIERSLAGDSERQATGDSLEVQLRRSRGGRRFGASKLVSAPNRGRSRDGARARPRKQGGRSGHSVRPEVRRDRGSRPGKPRRPT